MRSRAIYGDARGEVAVVEIGIRLAKLGHYLVDLELLGVLGSGVR